MAMDQMEAGDSEPPADDDMLGASLSLDSALPAAVSADAHPAAPYDTGPQLQEEVEAQDLALVALADDSESSSGEYRSIRSSELASASERGQS
eukprot:15286606-Alexandrium_andersonii.AAC.1